MSIKLFCLIVILFIPSHASSRIKKPDWATDLIYFSQYLKMDIDDAEKELSLCEFKLTDCESILLFLAKSNPSKAISTSNNILNGSLKLTHSEDDYFLKVKAAQVLARNGESKELIRLLESSDKEIDDVYTLAYAENFKFANEILDPFMSSQANLFCYYSAYIDPFLINNYKNKDNLIGFILSKILSENVIEHECAFKIIERNKQILTRKDYAVIGKKILDVVSRKNSSEIDKYINFINLWYSHFNKNDELTKRLLEHGLKKADLNNNLSTIGIVHDNLLMLNLKKKTKVVTINPRGANQDYIEPVRITNGVIRFTAVEFLLQKQYKNNWGVRLSKVVHSSE